MHFVCSCPQGKGISGPDDTFSFNSDFTSKLKRVRIPLVSVKDSASGPAASASLPPAVEEDRRCEGCCLVACLLVVAAAAVEAKVLTASIFAHDTLAEKTVLYHTVSVLSL